MPNTAVPQDGDSWLYRQTRAARHRPHFNTAAALFVLLLVTLIGAGAGLARGMLLSFDTAALIFLAGLFWMFAHSPVATIRARVPKQDAGRWGVLWSGVAVSSVAIVALGVELHAAETGGVIEVAIGAMSLVLSWCVLNTMFALNYAHEYYMGKDKALEFPGTDEPDYWDFMYFAFVLGMTFQVSDVAIARRSVRRVALVHGIIAFFFDVFILALSVNVVAGKV
jgi:uncharacterized membrane protein